MKERRILFMHKPVLYIAIGLPASGKSTYFSRIKTFPIVSSDRIRAELFGNEDMQYSDNYLSSHGLPAHLMSLKEKIDHSNRVIHSEMLERALKYLKEGMDTVYDGTNLMKKNRARLIRIFSPLCFIHGIYFRTSIEVCIQRDRERTSHTVGESGIRRMAAEFDLPEISEGFDVLETLDENGIRLSVQYRNPPSQ